MKRSTIIKVSRDKTWQQYDRYNNDGYSFSQIDLILESNFRITKSLRRI